MFHFGINLCFMRENWKQQISDFDSSLDFPFGCLILIYIKMQIALNTLFENKQTKALHCLKSSKFIYG